MKSKLRYRVNFVVGDWSGDGHSRTELVSVKANLSAQDIEKAYEKGTKSLNLDFKKTVCAEYQCSNLDIVIAKQFIDLGFEFDEKDDFDYVDSELYVRMYLYLVKLGDPSFEHVFDKEPEVVNIGGYGLFD